MERKKLNDVERDLLEGMKWFVNELKHDRPITCHRLVLNLEPQVYTADQVKATRKLLKLSQAMFAKFLGVSRKSVCAWEHGRTPPDIACRFMDEIQRNPESFRDRVRESLQVKTH